MKKYALSFLLVTSFTANADLVAFKFSPEGTDAAVGLSPENTVPPATGSAAFAQELSGTPLYFDTDRSVLSFGFLYVALSARPTAVGIHGPAPAGENAEEVIDLQPYHLPLFAGAGFVLGNVPYPPELVSDLLQGRHYIDLQSPAFPTGELRGQLVPAIPMNDSPTVDCVADGVAECGEFSTVQVEVADGDDDPLTVVWDWNGWPIQTNSVPASGAGALLTLTAEFPEDGVLTVTATDPDGAAGSCSTLVTVVDTMPPVIESAVVDRSVLWPPNHKMVPVSVEAVVTDGCSSAVWGIVSVSSNEAVEGKGDGRSSRDWEILDDHTVLLRAERSGRGAGRVYTLELQAFDEADNLSSPHSVQVTVPH